MLVTCVSTPSSVLLEWGCVQMYRGYVEYFVCFTAKTCLLANKNTKDDSSVFSHLSESYLSEESLLGWKENVKSYTNKIKDELKVASGHTFSPVDTGSVVERFGIPLGFKPPIVGAELRTDHDAMFVAEGLDLSLIHI